MLSHLSFSDSRCGQENASLVARLHAMVSRLALRGRAVAVALGCLGAGAAAAGADAANPADHLPAHVTRLTWFGERPDWRADGRRFVFLSRTFGEVYEYEFATGRIYSLSDHFLHHGFTRAQYLSNGDILLVGPDRSFDRTNREERRHARHDRGAMFVLRRPFDGAPVPLGVEVDEGPAVSRSRLRVAWTHGAQDRISVGDIEYAELGPRLVNIREVLNAATMPEKPRMVETQSFIPPEDSALTICAYLLGGGKNTDVFRLDVETGALTNLSQSPEAYDEPEGIFPDGRFTTVEHGSSRENAWPAIDIHKLALDGSGRLERITYFTEFPGWKASQSVVSDDGRRMLFQIGRFGDEAGRGYGVFLLDLARAAESWPVPAAP